MAGTNMSRPHPAQTFHLHLRQNSYVISFKSYFCKTDNFQWKHYDTFLTSICSENMSLFMKKPAFCICENKDADQLRGNREADQRLCFRYIDSTIPLLPKSEISSP